MGLSLELGNGMSLTLDYGTLNYAVNESPLTALQSQTQQQVPVCSVISASIFNIVSVSALKCHDSFRFVSVFVLLYIALTTHARELFSDWGGGQNHEGHISRRSH